jgi:hypothetical protein
MLEVKLLVVVIYAILIGVFFFLRYNKKEFDRSCYSEPCVRFCCWSEDCDESFVEGNFNFSSFEEGKIDRVVNLTVQGLIGKPDCFLRTVKDEEPWEFMLVRSGSVKGCWEGPLAD